MLFEASGRIGRLKYFKISIINIFCVFLVLGFSDFLNSDVVRVFLIIGFSIHINTTIKRLHDLNYSGWWIFGWWILLYLIPLVGIIFKINLFVAPGVDKDNRY